MIAGIAWRKKRDPHPHKWNMYISIDKGVYVSIFKYPRHFSGMWSKNRVFGLWFTYVAYRRWIRKLVKLVLFR